LDSESAVFHLRAEEKKTFDSYLREMSIVITNMPQQVIFSQQVIFYCWQTIEIKNIRNQFHSAIQPIKSKCMYLSLF
jgi:hypothetical protein